MVNTDSVNITHDGGNCFEFADDLSTVEESKLSKIWKRCANLFLKAKGSV